ncbi:MAG: futalosine hydrolase [Bacteroidetes bacterium GWA2_31_9b]|nr:MAG: futalosine hydrolase [Bacteroidetes bacterium GWA2_31_9b]
MKILIVSATEKEIFPIKSKLITLQSNHSNLISYQYNSLFVDVLITGIGSVFTTYSLTNHLNKTKYDLVINAGIAGSFRSEINIGDVFIVLKDQFADLGIEDSQSFSTLFEKGFMLESEFPFTNSMLINSTVLEYSFFKNINEISAITVNTTHGNVESSKRFKEKFNSDIETMEGAAFFYVCIMQKVKFIQIRAISNYVKEREKAKWNIPLAINNLNDKLFELLIVLDKEQKI